MRRRAFMGGILAATVAGAQTESVPKGRGRGRGQESAPTRQAKVVKLFKAPDGHPNAMEATAEGVWVGDQVTERAHLLDWKTGQIIRKVETESHNTVELRLAEGICGWPRMEE